MEAEQKQEMKRVIEEAGRCLKDGCTIRECKSGRLKKMMRKIAANIVLIELYDLNHIIISRICEGEFESIQLHIEDITERLANCLAIIRAKGENLNEVISDDQIDSAVKFTIFELIDDNEG